MTSTETLSGSALLSDNCANRDKHGRCLGTVYLPQPRKGRRIAPCECTCHANGPN